MANLNDMLYHGIRQQIRRVITALGDERTDKGLTAFEDGSKDWGNCFFARALKDNEVFKHSLGEIGVAKALGLTSTGTQSGYNLVPVRIVYHTFDELSTIITRGELHDFIVAVRDESRPAEVMQLLRSIDYTGVEATPVLIDSCQT